ncbi:uncharacterized protein LOC131434918 [Malaya genurostris]|uniref:uncharacterized protein LOC131434918 n=1 Tax=Malaya genurostris TaxID=325434 RepID=UPI0026F40319|nr:uncharacterized protein LOC131434918 [Malaya genurostris]
MNIFLKIILFSLLAAHTKACSPGETCPEERSCTADFRCPRFDDGDSAVLIPHTDCTKFFKCSSGRACEYQCPGVLHFNPRELACDWPDKACCDSNVVCKAQRCIPGLNCGLNDGNRPHNPNVPPITNDFEERIQTNTGNNERCLPGINCTLDNENQLPNQNIPPRSNGFEGRDQMNIGNNNQCIPGLTCTLHDDMRIPNQNIPSISDEFDQRNQIGTLENVAISCFTNNRCPINDDLNNPVVLQHTNCQRFYKCFNGQACELLCPAGQHFNARSGACDHPNIACCDSSVACTGSTSISTNCQYDSRCSLYEDSMNPTHLPHTNCDLFYKCAHGKACQLSCPQGQHFSRAHGRCEFPNIACCDPTVPCHSVLSWETITNPPSSETPPTSGNSAGCKPDARCTSIDGPRKLLLRHESCSKFYQCFSGYACEFVCPLGLQFDERQQLCQWSQNSSCSMAA